MQTVMTALIERINKAAEGLKSTKEHGPFEYGQYSILIGILNDAEEMIKQEKQMLIDFYTAGKLFGYWDTSKTAEQYYNQIYGGTHGTGNKE